MRRDSAAQSSITKLARVSPFGHDLQRAFLAVTGFAASENLDAHEIETEGACLRFNNLCNTRDTGHALLGGML